MTAIPVSRPADRAGRRPAPVTLVAIVFIAVVAALYGAQLAAGAFRSSGHGPASPAVGVPVAVSFGSVTVEQAQTIDGLTSRDMWNGMTHGISGLVHPDEAQVAVSVYLANDGAGGVPVDAGQFRLAVEGRDEAVPPAGGTLLPVRLLPGSGVRGTLVFVVPLGGARTSVVYNDPAGPAVTVPVGALGEPPPDDPGHPGATAGHDE
jgi:hypothetical protein